MPTTQFDRDSTARWYAGEHLKTDPGITSVHYLPAGSGEREIRLIEVNRLIGARNDDSLQPIDFGIDSGTETAHRLIVLDVTPEQWELITCGELALPPGWSLEGHTRYADE